MKQLKNIQTTTSSCIKCPNFWFKQGFAGGIEFQCKEINDNSNGRLIPHESDWNAFIHEDCPLTDAREQGVKVGVAVILLNEKNELLVGRRDNVSSGNDSWGLPGGGMEAGELPKETANREMKEETSLKIIDLDKLEFASFTNDSFMEESGEHWITLYFLCRYDNWTGQVKRVEPHKCKEWRWVDVNNIPEPFFCDWARDPNLKLLKERKKRKKK